MNNTHPDLRSGCYTSHDLSIFDPKEYFKEYPFYEEYNKDKIYDKEEFSKDFGFGEHTYEYSYYVISDSVDHDQTKTYIVAKEILSEDEQRELAKYCECRYHELKWYNISKYFTCRCCVGCLDSPFPQQYTINKARENMRKNKIEN